MDSIFKNSLWQQFGAALDMFEEGVKLCPDSLWTAALWDDPDDACYGQFWFVAYHVLSWCDLFLTGTREGFTPPAPFIRGKLPDSPYTKENIQNYLTICRQKSQTVIEGLTDEKAAQICTFEWMRPTFYELQIYNLRHVQEHSSQFRYFLGRNGIATNDWVSYVGQEIG
jgi:hypothetical protein